MPIALLAIAAQSTLCPQAVSNYKAPKTPDGKPDLQGIWTNVTITPLERPRDLADKAYFTEQEARAYEKQFLQQNNADRREGGAQADLGRAYNDFWYDRGTKVVASRRTSLITDPPDGKIPPLTPEAQKRQADRAAAARGHQFDGPENRALSERCLVWPTAGPPMLPSFYNNNYQIVQAPGYVMVLVEMVHDVRIIPTDGRPHLPSNVREWFGDSRGHWEGDTLVVETTNFTDKSPFHGSDENMKLIEKFTRTGPDTILYEFTVNDPTVFTKPWTGQVPMNRMQGPIIEYACHEGNYAMSGMLAGARADEERSRADEKKQ
ncbi:MAG: hypothetical protein JO062_01525 [Bryobacterales bacterium]|nr:hypothetical protein [Bryobacterales bacterium]